MIKTCELGQKIKTKFDNDEWIKFMFASYTVGEYIKPKEKDI